MSSRMSWAVGDAFAPIFRSGAAAVRPGVAPSTSRQVMPRAPSSDVRTIIE